MPASYAILVIWQDGSEEHLKRGQEVALFPSRKEAEEMAEFMRIGTEGAQSINVMPFHQLSQEVRENWLSGCAVMGEHDCGAKRRE